MCLRMVLVSSLKGSGKLLSKAQNGVKATVYACRRLETMFRVYAFSVRPVDRGQHVKQPQKSASHDVATEGILTELRMTLLYQTRPDTWSWRGMPLAHSARACGDVGLPFRTTARRMEPWHQGRDATANKHSHKQSSNRKLEAGRC
jgi:hypothetical protein